MSSRAKKKQEHYIKRMKPVIDRRTQEQDKRWPVRLKEVRDLLRQRTEDTFTEEENDLLHWINADSGQWGTCACGEQHNVLGKQGYAVNGPWDERLDVLGMTFTDLAGEIIGVLGDSSITDPTERMMADHRAKVFGLLDDMEKVQHTIQDRAVELLESILDGSLLKTNNCPMFIQRGEYDEEEIKSALYGNAEQKDKP